MRIRLNGTEMSLPEHARYLDAVKALWGDTRSILGIRRGGLSLALTALAEPDAHVCAITYEQEEGQRIYERSLRFVLLVALRDLFPGVPVKIEFSTYLGVYFTLDGVSSTDADAVRVEARMRELIESDIAFEKVYMTREEAVEYFERVGAPDKVRLLYYRPFERFDMYALNGYLDYFYGVMAPSTGYTPVFRVLAHAPGMELMLPDPSAPDRCAEHRSQPKLFELFAQHNDWGNILGCGSAADLNELVDTHGIREFIRVNEALHEKAIAQIADAFLASGARVILIAGPSSSGKTTFANRLYVQLRVLGCKPLKLSLDDYYLDRDAIPRESDGTVDLEKLETLDVALFNTHLSDLLTGATVQTPLFDFVSGKRTPQTRALVAAPEQPLLIEGIHALNDQLTYTIPDAQKFKIFVSALTTINLDDHNRIRTTDVRLLRRIVRDHQFRGTTPEATMAMWDSVKRGENHYIFPYQESANVMFNSTLHYELAILKRYAYPMLLRTPPDSAYYTRAHRLLKFLNYFVAADVEEEIPNNSILREFLGGCCFYRHRKDDE